MLLVSGSMLTVSRQHNFFIYVTVDLYPLYPATDGQQTGNNFVTDNKQHVDGNRQHVARNMLPGNMLPWCKRGFKSAFVASNAVSVFFCLIISKDQV